MSEKRGFFASFRSHLFGIHHFLVRSILKYLFAHYFCKNLPSFLSARGNRCLKILAARHPNLPTPSSKKRKWTRCWPVLKNKTATGTPSCSRHRPKAGFTCTGIFRPAPGFRGMRPKSASKLVLIALAVWLEPAPPTATNHATIVPKSHCGRRNQMLGQ